MPGARPELCLRLAVSNSRCSGGNRADFADADRVLGCASVLSPDSYRRGLIAVLRKRKVARCSRQYGKHLISVVMHEQAGRSKGLRIRTVLRPLLGAKRPGREAHPSLLIVEPCACDSSPQPSAAIHRWGLTALPRDGSAVAKATFRVGGARPPFVALLMDHPRTASGRPSRVWHRALAPPYGLTAEFAHSSPSEPHGPNVDGLRRERNGSPTTERLEEGGSNEPLP